MFCRGKRQGHLFHGLNQQVIALRADDADRPPFFQEISCAGSVQALPVDFNEAGGTQGRYDRALPADPGIAAGGEHLNVVELQVAALHADGVVGGTK